MIYATRGGIAIVEFGSRATLCKVSHSPFYAPSLLTSTQLTIRLQSYLPVIDYA